MNSFYTKIVGVTYDNRQELIEQLYDDGQLNMGQQLLLVRENNNSYDKNAVAVMHPCNVQLGYLSKDIASNIAPNMDNGINYTVTVSAVTGVDNYGVNIQITEDEFVSPSKDTRNIVVEDTERSQVIIDCLKDTISSRELIYKTIWEILEDAKTVTSGQQTSFEAYNINKAQNVFRSYSKLCCSLKRLTSVIYRLEKNDFEDNLLTFLSTNMSEFSNSINLFDEYNQEATKVLSLLNDLSYILQNNGNNAFFIKGHIYNLNAICSFNQKFINEINKIITKTKELLSGIGENFWREKNQFDSYDYYQDEYCDYNPHDLDPGDYEAWEDSLYK